MSQIEGIDIGVGGSNLQINDGGSEGLLSGICNAIYEVIDTLSNMMDTNHCPLLASSLPPRLQVVQIKWTMLTSQPKALLAHRYTNRTHFIKPSLELPILVTNHSVKLFMNAEEAIA